MNEENALTIVSPPRLAEYRKTATGLAELRGRLANIVYNFSTATGVKVARADRRECVKLRTSLEALRVELKAPALERSRLIDSEAKALTAAILELEKPIDEAIQSFERAKEQARQAKIDAEAARVARLRDHLAALVRFPAEAIRQDAAGVARTRHELANTSEGWAESFQEFAGEARAAQAAGLEFLDELIAKKRAEEAERARNLARFEETEQRARALRDQLAELAARERAVQEGEAREAARVAAAAERERELRARIAGFGAVLERGDCPAAALRTVMAELEAARPGRDTFGELFDEAAAEWALAWDEIAKREALAVEAEEKARQEAAAAAQARQEAAERERQQEAARERQEAANRVAVHRAARLQRRREARERFAHPTAALAGIRELCASELSDELVRQHVQIIAEAFTLHAGEEFDPPQPGTDFDTIDGAERAK